MDDTDVYTGSSFSVEHAGGDWAIWRYSGHDGEREQIILTTAAMDELASYFAECYREDKVAAMREP